MQPCFSHGVGPVREISCHDKDLYWKRNNLLDKPTLFFARCKWHAECLSGATDSVRVFKYFASVLHSRLPMTAISFGDVQW